MRSKLLLSLILSTLLVEAASARGGAADQLKVQLAFDQRTLVGDYERAGKRSPKWDAAARVFLEAMAVRFAEANAPDELDSGKALSVEALLKQADALKALGCDDSLVQYCLATLLTDSGRQVTAARLLESIQNDFFARDYHPYRKWALAKRIADISHYDRDLKAVALVRRTPDFLAFLKSDVADHREWRIRYRQAVEYVEKLDKDAREPFMIAVEKIDGIDPWFVAALRGHVEIDLAWQSRGSGWANTVTEEGWRGFYLHLERARASLVKAWELKPAYPEPAARMITVCMGGGGEEGDTARLWFDRAIGAEVDYVRAWDAMIECVNPRWGGSYEAVIALGEEALDTERFDTAVPRLYRHVLWLISNDRGPDYTIYTHPKVWPNLERLWLGYKKANLPGVDPVALDSRQAALGFRCQQYQAFLDIRRRLGKDYQPAFAEGLGFDDADAVVVAEAATGAQAEDVITALAQEINEDWAAASTIWKKLATTPEPGATRQLAVQSLAVNTVRSELDGGQVASVGFDDPSRTPAWRGLLPDVWRVEDGELVCEASGRNEFEIRHRSTIPQSRRIRLEFRLEPKGQDLLPRVSVHLQRSRSNGIIRCDVDAKAGHIVIRGEDGWYVRSERNLPIAVETWHELVIEQRDSEMRVFLNGKQVGIDKKTGLARGEPILGLSVWAADRGGGARFRGVTVEALRGQ